MSNNINSFNDDDLFEDYVEPSSYSDLNSNFSDQESIDKVFPDIDSPFRNLIQNSSIKVNFGDAFYNAAREWTNQGYREANAVAMMEALAEITNGKFLYNHRLITSREILVRKKTIIKFLSMMLSNESIETIVKISGENSTIKFSDNYFNMFFRSFYNIQIHTYYCELAVYNALSQMLDLPIDPDLSDPHIESELLVLNSSEHINDLYLKYFEKEELAQKIESCIDEIFQKQKA
jgi:hypothetical protein